MNKQNLIDLFKKHLAAYQSIASQSIAISDGNLLVDHKIIEDQASIRSAMNFIKYTRYLAEKLVPTIIEQLEQSNVDNEPVVNYIKQYRHCYKIYILHNLMLEPMLNINSFWLLDELPSDAEIIAQEPVISEPVAQNHLIQDHLIIDSNRADEYEPLAVLALMSSTDSNGEYLKQNDLHLDYDDFYFKGDIGSFAIERQLSEEIKSLENGSEITHEPFHSDTTPQAQEPTNIVRASHTASISDPQKKPLVKEKRASTPKFENRGTNNTAMFRALQYNLKETGQEERDTSWLGHKRMKTENGEPSTRSGRPIIPNPRYTASTLRATTPFAKASPRMPAEQNDNTETTALRAQTLASPTPNFFSSISRLLRNSPLLSATTETDSVFSLTLEKNHLERTMTIRPLFSHEERLLKNISKQLETKESSSLPNPK
jgi:hypothetical protein